MTLAAKQGMIMFNQIHQSFRSSVVGMALCLLPAVAAVPAEGQPAMTAAAAAPAGSASLDVVLLEVKGTVQASTDDGKTLTPAKPGLHVTQGDSFRTGFRSSITCGIAADRAFTLDSLSTIRLDTAILNGKHYKTDLVMEYAAVSRGMTAQRTYFGNR